MRSSNCGNDSMFATVVVPQRRASAKPAMIEERKSASVSSRRFALICRIQSANERCGSIARRSAVKSRWQCALIRSRKQHHFAEIIEFSAVDALIRRSGQPQRSARFRLATAPSSIGGPSIVTTVRARKDHSPFTTLRASATSRLHASWQSKRDHVFAASGLIARSDEFIQREPQRRSRQCLIARPQNRPQATGRAICERQTRPTVSSICSSLIFAATRYIPVCRPSVSRSGVRGSPFACHAARAASRPG